MADAPSPAPLPVRRHIVGEPWVWLTGMGLALAIGLVICLLCVVVANGLSVFWPRSVQLYTATRDGATATFFASEIKRQQRRPPGSAEVEEVQVFLGNKELNNNVAYRFFDAAALTAATPADVLVVERLEYGQAIGLPVALIGRDGAALPAEDPAFAARLDARIAAAAAVRDELEELKRGRIGDNSREIKHLKDELLEMAARGRDDPARAGAIRARIAVLEKEYVDELLPAKRAIEERLGGDRLVLRLGDGRESRIDLGGVIEAYRPNQLGALAKVGRFVRGIALFLWENPREANTEGGIFPAIVGTFTMTLLMSVAVVPFGVLAAIYLREYAKQGVFVRFVRISVNNLAGVPSIVFGVFGLGFFVYLVGGQIDAIFHPGRAEPVFGTPALVWAAATLALMTVPVVIVATEEAIAAVPRGMKEGSLACGASKWQTIQRIVLPASVPGILTGLILAMARGAGEVAPLMLVGVVKLAPELPIGGEFPWIHLDYKFMHLGFHIYDVGFQSPDSEAAKPMVFATTLVLILLVLALNLSAILIRERLRRKYATGAF